MRILCVLISLSIFGSSSLPSSTYSNNDLTLKHTIKNVKVIAEIEKDPESRPHLNSKGSIALSMSQKTRPEAKISMRKKTLRKSNNRKKTSQLILEAHENPKIFFEASKVLQMLSYGPFDDPILPTPEPYLEATEDPQIQKSPKQFLKASGDLHIPKSLLSSLELSEDSDTPKSPATLKVSKDLHMLSFGPFDEPVLPTPDPFLEASEDPQIPESPEPLLESSEDLGIPKSPEPGLESAEDPEIPNSPAHS